MTTLKVISNCRNHPERRVLTTTTHRGDDGLTLCRECLKLRPAFNAPDAFPPGAYTPRAVASLAAFSVPVRVGHA